jgi:hypothetical protein
MGVPRFCSKCGAPLNAASNFCPSCGKPVNKPGAPEAQAPLPPAPAPPPPVPAPGPAYAPQAAAPTANPETIHLILSGAQRHSGFLGLKIEPFIIVFTNLRIIFAFQTTRMMQENVRQARQQAEQEGKGFFGKWGAQLGANSGKQYQQVPPQQILAETPNNFAIHREHLRSIRMREDYSAEDSPSTYTMEFDTVAGKHKFKFGHLNMRDLKKFFQQLYGDIVR